MKRIAKLLAGLYPAAWRERYGEEFQGLIEDRELHVADLFDVLWAGLKMQLTSPNFVRIVLPCALAGAAVTTVVAFRIPALYSSETVLVISGAASTNEGQVLPTDSESARQEIAPTVTAALGDRDAMAEIIRRYNLYPGDRSKLPMDDVIREMQKAILVLPVSDRRLDQAIHLAEQMPGRNAAAMKNGRKYIRSAFAVVFEYPDPHVAQKVDADLVGLLFAKNLALAGSQQSVEGLSNMDGASLAAKPNGLPRSVDSAIGLLVGGLFGAMVAAVRSRRNSPLNEAA